MGSSTTGQSSGSGGGVVGEVRLLLGLIGRFLAGFHARSWEAAATAEVEEDVVRFQALELPSGAKSAVAPEAVRLLRRRRELVFEQARLSQLSSRFMGMMAVATVVGAPILNSAPFGVDGGHLFQLLFEYCLLLAGAWLLVSLPLPLLRLARSPGTWLWLVWLGLVVSAYAAALWTLYTQLAAGPLLTRLSADSAIALAATAAALLAAGALVVELLAWSVLRVWIEVGLRRQWETSNPQVAVVRGLLVVLRILYGLRGGADMGDQSAMDVTGVLWATVESTAETVEAGFGRVLDRRNSFGTETRDVVARIAAGLRALKGGVSIRGPLREDGCPVVDADGLRRVESTFLSWAGGGVDDLPRGEPRPPRLARRRRGALQQVAAAVGPLVILLLVRIARLDLGAFGPLLVAVAIAWLISGLLYALLGEDLEAYVQRASGWGRILGAAGSVRDAAS